MNTILEKAPLPHQQFLRDVKKRTESDKRLLGVAISGSLANGTGDSESDIDLQIIVDTVFYNQVLSERDTFISQFGEVISSFTGEHVGEPRLSIVLFKKDLLHVDFKFINLDSFRDQRVDSPVVLWEKGTRLSDIVKDHPKFYPQVKVQWIEDRFWVWVHYIGSKIKRGEYIEALDSIAWMRELALSPMIRAAKGQRNRASRFLERDAPEYIEDLLKTHPKSADLASLKSSLQAAVDLYVKVRSLQKNPIKIHPEAEAIIRNFVSSL